jgi:hypothetical protein
MSLIDLDTKNVETALEGMPYPAATWQIIAWAEYNAVPQAIVDSLLDLPDRWFSNPGEIVLALRAPVPAPAPVCGHKRHPRGCPWLNWDRRLDLRAS